MTAPTVAATSDLTRRLQIGKSLGTGAYAIVHKAMYDGRPVALKVLLPQHTPSEREDCPVKMFLREGEMLRSIGHSNVLRCLDILHLPPCFPGLLRGYTRPAPALVLELLEGGSLGSLMHKQLLAPWKFLYDNGTALSWSTQLAAALAHLHGCSPPIIHRDVKLENIMLTGPSEGSVRGGGSCGGALKLVDLGLATAPLSLERCTGATLLRAPLSTGHSFTSAPTSRMQDDSRRPTDTLLASETDCAPGAVPASVAGVARSSFTAEGSVRSGAAGSRPTSAAATLPSSAPRPASRGQDISVRSSASAASSAPVFYLVKPDGTTAYELEIHGGKHGQQLRPLSAYGPQLRQLQLQHQALLQRYQQSKSSIKRTQSVTGAAPLRSLSGCDAVGKDRPASTGAHAYGQGRSSGSRPFATASMPIAAAGGSLLGDEIFRLSETGEDDALRGRASAEQGKGAEPTHGSSGAAVTPSSFRAASAESGCGDSCGMQGGSVQGSQLQRMLRSQASMGAASTPGAILATDTACTACSTDATSDDGESTVVQELRAFNGDTDSVHCANRGGGIIGSCSSAFFAQVMTNTADTRRGDKSFFRLPPPPTNGLDASAPASSPPAATRLSMTPTGSVRLAAEPSGSTLGSRPATATDVHLGTGPAADGRSRHGEREDTQEVYPGLLMDSYPLEFVYHLTRETGSCMTMAPEVRLAQPYNEKVDVYAFGVVLYEIWSRSLLSVSHIGTRRPGLPEIVHRCEDWPDVIVGGYRPTRVDAVPEPIWRLITECWDADPLCRPPMAEVEARLRSMAEDPQQAEAVMGLSSGKGGRRINTACGGGKAEVAAAVPSCGCTIC